MNVIKWVQVAGGVFVLLFSSVIFFFITEKTTGLFVAWATLVATILGYFIKLTYDVKKKKKESCDH